MLSCQIVLMSSPLKHTHCEATQHSLATSKVRMRKKKKVNDIEEGGNPCYPRLQLGDVDHSAPHKVHKHTGFNVSVNALQIPSLPLLALLTPPLHVFQQSERYSKM